VPLALHRGLNTLGGRARKAGGCDDLWLAPHEAVEGGRHRVNALLRHNNRAVSVGVDKIAAPYSMP
jgi:hypothetical protein